MKSAFDTDYFIIGSGFGGSVAAMRLTEKNYNVIVAEQGHYFTPKNMPKSTSNIRQFLWLPILACRGFFAMNLFKHMLVLHGNAVGGGSIVYANTLLIPSQSIWEHGSWAGLNQWKNIMPTHYQTAQSMLGVTTNPTLADADTTLQQISTYANASASFYRTRVAVYFGENDEQAHPIINGDPYFHGQGPVRKPCVSCGGCMVGCRFLAKNSLDFNYLYFAKKQGANILAQTTVTKIEPLGIEKDGSDGYRITVKTAGQAKRCITARNVILSAGSLGTQKLLFSMRDKGYLPHISNALGKNIFTNAESLIGIRFPNTTKDFSKGIAIGSGIYLNDGTHIEATRFPAGSNIASLLGIIMNYTRTGRLPLWKWLTKIIKLALGHPVRFWQIIRPKNVARESIIFLCMQATPYPLQIIWKRSFLMPWRKHLATQGKAIPSHIPSATNLALEAAEKLNGSAFNCIADVFLKIPATAHCMGGAALAKSAEYGVCDAQHRVFGYQNLYVIDGSNISTNLGVNPSLTITALAEAAISHIPPKEIE